MATLIAYRRASSPGSRVKGNLPDDYVTEHTHLDDQPKDFLQEQEELGQPWEVATLEGFAEIWNKANTEHPAVEVTKEGRIASTGCPCHGSHKDLCAEFQRKLAKEKQQKQSSQ